MARGDLWVDDAFERRHESVLASRAWRERAADRARREAVIAAAGRERRRLLARLSGTDDSRRSVVGQDLLAALAAFRRQGRS